MSQDSVLRCLERSRHLLTSEEIANRIKINRTTVATNLRRLFVQGVIYYECYFNRSKPYGHKEERHYGVVKSIKQKTKELQRKVNSLRRFK